MYTWVFVVLKAAARQREEARAEVKVLKVAKKITIFFFLFRMGRGLRHVCVLCECARARVHLCKHICLYACMYVCMHACMHAC